jgi:tetratricopeptide (TPR) repeat protein
MFFSSSKVPEVPDYYFDHYLNNARQYEADTEYADALKLYRQAYALKPSHSVNLAIIRCEKLLESNPMPTGLLSVLDEHRIMAHPGGRPGVRTKVLDTSQVAAKPVVKAEPDPVKDNPVTSDLKTQDKVSQYILLLSRELAYFNIDTALEILTKAIELNKTIVDAKVVADYGYIEPTILERSLEQLKAWQAGFNKRRVAGLESSVALIMKLINGKKPLDYSDNIFVRTTIDQLFYYGWQKLDQRNMVPLCEKIATLVQQSSSGDLFGMRILSSTFNLPDRDALKRDLERCLVKHAPMERREPIILEMFTEKQGQTLRCKT